MELTQNLRRRLNTTKVLMLTIDLGLLIYWAITALHLIPADMAFRDYSNPVVVAWNWSFLPLDILAVITGIAWTIAARRHPLAIRTLALLLTSLTLTFAAGLMAICFWAIYGDFELSWWLPNLTLIVVPTGCGLAIWCVYSAAASDWQPLK